MKTSIINGSEVSRLSVAIHKYVVEEKLDNCETQSFNREIDTKESTSGWRRWLRKPVRDREVEDPYPAKFGHQ